MSALFRLSVHFLQPYCHARGESDVPEWPPSPLRMFQALVNAAAARWNERQSLVFAGPALYWFETLRPPEIRCGIGTRSSQTYRLYVPDNVADRVAAMWTRNQNASIADYRSEKDVRATYLDSDYVHYLYVIDQSPQDVEQHLDVLRLAAHSITHLGWGVDMVAADADLIHQREADRLPGERWLISSSGPRSLRCPRPGSLDQILLRHQAFLSRLKRGAQGEETFDPVPPIRVLRSVCYRRISDPQPRPYAIFKLLDANDDPYRHPHSKLVHIAGMVRHLAISAMTRNPPPSVKEPATWIKRYVAGHRDAADKAVDLPHAQLSYVPLPSIGHHHTDPAVRRVMIVAPVGDDAILEHLSQQLDGLRLEPEGQQDLRVPVFLHRARHDNVGKFYTQPDEPENYGYSRWASVTPVILPGHDDHKPEKTRKLIEKALVQSGIDQPCEFEWSAFSHFPKSYSAHKYDKSKRLIGYIRPDHLIDQTAVHLTLMFPLGLKVPGPLTIGAGRHCGFGLMAGIGD